MCMQQQIRVALGLGTELMPGIGLIPGQQAEKLDKQSKPASTWLQKDWRGRCVLILHAISESADTVIQEHVKPAYLDVPSDTHMC